MKRVALCLVMSMSVACTSNASTTTVASRPPSPAASAAGLPGTSSSSSPFRAGTGSLLRIDPVTNSIVAKAYAVGHVPSAIAIGSGSVWVVSAGDGSILRLDSATGQVEASTLVHQPRGIALGGGVPGVWVFTLGQLWRIDPRSNDATLVDDLTEAIGAVAIGDGSVWVTGFRSGLDRVDPTTGRLHRNLIGPVLRVSNAQGRDGEHFRAAHRR